MPYFSTVSLLACPALVPVSILRFKHSMFLQRKASEEERTDPAEAVQSWSGNINKITLGGGILKFSFSKMHIWRILREN